MSKLRKRSPTLSSLRKKFKCSGGPFHNGYLYLETPGTLTFKMRDWCGYYNERMQWVPVA